MEKFSNWRDPSTGLAPFVYPLPPLSSLRYPGLIGLIFYPLAVVRTSILVVLACIFALLNRSWDFMFAISPELRKRSRSCTACVLGRVALYLLGFSRLPAERPFTNLKKLVTKAQVKNEVRAGDVVVVNWSSYVDIIYLTYLYDPIFLLPNPISKSQQDKPHIEGFCERSAIELITTAGHPPPSLPHQLIGGRPKTLSQWGSHGRKLGQPVVVFPEATTSNNRAILRFVKLTPELFGSPDPETRFFCLAIKHESPTLLRPSITTPIPSRFWNLSHILRVNLSPILFPGLSPRSLTLRYPRSGPMERPSKKELFEECGEVMVNVSKMRQTSKIGWSDKAGFLAYVEGRRIS